MRPLDPGRRGGDAAPDDHHVSRENITQESEETRQVNLQSSAEAKNRHMPSVRHFSSTKHNFSLCFGRGIVQIGTFSCATDAGLAFRQEFT